MQLDTEAILELLQKQNFISADDRHAAEEYDKKRDASAIDYLLQHGVLTKDLLGQAIAESFEVPYADLNTNKPGEDLVQLIPEKTAKKYRAVAYQQSPKAVTVTTDDPTAAELKSALKKIFPKKKVSLAYSLSEDIDDTFVHFRKPLDTRFQKIIKQDERVAPDIIDEIIADAISFRASDVHFEPHPDEAVVRFRVDGILQEAGRIAIQHYESILNRIKIMAHLRIDEHHAAQDGSMQFSSDGNEVDIRVSIVPIVDGEKVVLRILGRYLRRYTLSNLGLLSSHQEAISEAAHKPFGMVLVTGPTGSGKTTTLYAVLRLIDTPEINITTIEDPVEYKIVGVNQIQVNAQTGLSFAKLLRSIVRQDPDVILVGEIRDEETAEIAINAALTGHLMLSTFHANDAASTIPRILELGVEPFLVSSTIEVIVAQRLVRTICEHCRTSYQATPADLDKKLPGAAKALGKKTVSLYRGKGCTICADTGYSGRTGVFEVLPMTAELQAMTLERPSAGEISTYMKKQKLPTFFDDAMQKVAQGITTIEEVRRVIGGEAT